MAFRPGVVQGAYPERQDERPPGLSRALRAVVGALRVPQRASRAKIAALVRSVDAEATGLDGLDEPGFDRAAAELRLALRRDGLREALLPRLRVGARSGAAHHRNDTL